MTPGDSLLKFPSMILFVIAFGKPSDQETETIKFGVGDKLGSISKEEQTLTLCVCVCIFIYTKDAILGCKQFTMRLWIIKQLFAC